MRYTRYLSISHSYRNIGREEPSGLRQHGLAVPYSCSDDDLGSPYTLLLNWIPSLLLLMSFSSLIYSLVLVEHIFQFLLKKRQVRGKFSRPYVWNCLYFTSYLIDSLAKYWVLGWKSFSLRILKALLQGLLASGVALENSQAHSDFWFWYVPLFFFLILNACRFPVGSFFIPLTAWCVSISLSPLWALNVLFQSGNSLIPFLPFFLGVFPFFGISVLGNYSDQYSL